ncbi:hypothetical protein RFI_22724 [Reticulomyxa filosa]|uniref:Uncharacterized protein n=1 Tax=Reticulomyxa filosa TaxID=46433 RepID=X6ML93_RETFI|nr:hypothetical protein RFI_22724 [Reticulomyxa filosa]|eukprot:ETO14644.1 hypothetical protein RFI_22724 [Reticulomyxa filosa]
MCVRVCVSWQERPTSNLTRLTLGGVKVTEKCVKSIGLNFASSLEVLDTFKCEWVYEYEQLKSLQNLACLKHLALRDLCIRVLHHRDGNRLITKRKFQSKDFHTLPYQQIAKYHHLEAMLSQSIFKDSHPDICIVVSYANVLPIWAKVFPFIYIYLFTFICLYSSVFMLAKRTRYFKRNGNERNTNYDHKQ